MSFKETFCDIRITLHISGDGKNDESTLFFIHQSIYYIQDFNTFEQTDWSHFENTQLWPLLDKKITAASFSKSSFFNQISFTLYIYFLFLNNYLCFLVENRYLFQCFNNKIWFIFECFTISYREIKFLSHVFK